MSERLPIRDVLQELTRRAGFPVVSIGCEEGGGGALGRFAANDPRLACGLQGWTLDAGLRAAAEAWPPRLAALFRLFRLRSFHLWTEDRPAGGAAPAPEAAAAELEAFLLRLLLDDADSDAPRVEIGSVLKLRCVPSSCFLEAWPPGGGLPALPTLTGDGLLALRGLLRDLLGAVRLELLLDGPAGLASAAGRLALRRLMSAAA